MLIPGVNIGVLVHSASTDTRRAGLAPTNVYFVSATALHALKETCNYHTPKKTIF